MRSLRPYPIPLLHKLGGSRGNRTLLDRNLARIPRSPLLPPIIKHTILTRQKSLRYTSLVCFMIGASVWNRTTIPGFVGQYIIHYTTEAKLAGALGIEPRLTESKSVVLPLHNTPTN